MTGALLLTAAVMGLAGSAHCAGMCSVACGAAGRACVPGAPRRGVAALLLARTVAYVAAGVAVGLLADGLRWWLDASAWLRPLWTVMQVALVGVGLWLLVSGELPPAWLRAAQRLGRPRTLGRQTVHLPGELKAASMGLLWPLLPCGLLHAALAVAALASTPLEAGQVMAAFAVTSSSGLLAGHLVWRWLPLRMQGTASGAAGRPAVRLAGAGMAVLCAWPLLRHLWVPLQAAWCG